MTTTDQPGVQPPRVSVVIPTHNRREALTRCLESLLRQTYTNYEVIVVDDGSTDDTPQYLRDFAAAHPDFALSSLRNEQSLGATRSRNLAVHRASGHYVAFIDSDCIADSDWLHGLVSAFRGPSIGAVTGHVADAPPENVYELAMRGTSRVAKGKTARRLVACNMMVPHALIAAYPFDEETKIYAEEEALQLRLGAAGFRLGSAPDAVVLHEHHYDLRRFFRRAWLGGAAAAWLVYKFRQPPRIDILPFLLFYLTLPTGLIARWWLVAPAGFFLLGVIALAYNEMFRKGKSLVTALQVLPLQVLYYQLRLASYTLRSIRLHCGMDRVERVRLTRRGSAGGNTTHPESD